MCHFFIQVQIHLPNAFRDLAILPELPAYKVKLYTVMALTLSLTKIKVAAAVFTISVLLGTV